MKLFEQYQRLPEEIQEIIERHCRDGELTYLECENFLQEMEGKQYTFDWYLDATPYDLRPKNIRIYDNGGETLDRITVVFTGKYRHKTNGDFMYLSMSETASGICEHGYSDTQIDRPAYSHLGKKIKWEDLSDGCQVAILETYNDLFLETVKQ